MSPEVEKLMTLRAAEIKISMAIDLLKDAFPYVVSLEDELKTIHIYQELSKIHDRLVLSVIETGEQISGGPP